MTRILVDPVELRDVAIVLQRLATESADIGSKLSSSTRVAMPAQVRGLVDQFVATSDAVLDQVATELLEEAIDLLNRAIFAASDSVATASIGSQLPSTLVIGGRGAAPFVVLDPSGTPVSPNIGVSVVGGGGAAPFVVLDPSGTPVSPNIGVSVLGGQPGTAILGGATATVGGTGANEITVVDATGRGLSLDAFEATLGSTSSITNNRAAGPASGLLAIAEVNASFTTRLRNQVDAIVSDPNVSPAGIAVASGITNALGDNLSHQLAPSQFQLELAEGHFLTPTEVRSISPTTIPPSERTGTTSLSTSIFPGGPNIGLFAAGADGVIGLDDILATRTNGLLARGRASRS